MSSLAAELAAFTAGLSFPLDDFQTRACQAVARGSSVLVCAPTGAGKTVVGEFAVHLALTGTGRPGAQLARAEPAGSAREAGSELFGGDAGGGALRKAFYTTPIKALSNQKYHDLVRQHGPERVGLLTGDNSINGDAPVVVMTTEVLRNMLYAGSPTLTGLAYVVMDEVHYLADRFRGAVWEEVIIHLPASVSLVALSATVSNAEEFADWLVTVRGETEVVVSEHRPVPLWQHMLVGRRMHDLFQAERVNPSLLEQTRELTRRTNDRGYGRRRGWRSMVPSRPEVVERLDREGLLPAIVFIFSRAGCDAAVAQCRVAGLQLTTPEERAEIRRVAQTRTGHLTPEDRAALGYSQWLAGLENGLAAHHAGALPAFKEVVEELFVRGLVKAVFATETLALGINMPARSVVLERLVKFDGEAHADLTPGEYTQLTGRAGRRGIDVEGHAVVVWSPEVDPRRVAGLATTRTYPLESSFRPSYNMVVNLVGRLGTAAARTLLESSFAQFQADRAVVGIARQVRRHTEEIGALAAEADCHLGDFGDYLALRRSIAERERSLARAHAATRRAAARASLDKLRIGDVIEIPSGRRAGLAVVLDPDTRGYGDPRPLVLTERRWAGRVPTEDFTAPVRSLARIRVPRHFNHRAPAARRDLAATLRAAAPSEQGSPTKAPGLVGEPSSDEELAGLRARLRAHPCHGCAQREEHTRAAERMAQLEQETVQMQGQAELRTESLVRMFDRVCAVLAARGYVTRGGEVTESGRTLARIWTESDLLVAECLRRGVWDGLDPAELAAAVSVVVYESRRDEDGPAPVPRGPVADAVDATRKLAAELTAEEAGRKLSLTREPDTGFAWPVYRWARGEPLVEVLARAGGPDEELAAGDFVRWARQVVDLLGQLVEAPECPPSVSATAQGAIQMVRRGVVTHIA